MEHFLGSFNGLADVRKKMVVARNCESDVKGLEESDQSVLQVHCKVRSRKQLSSEVKESPQSRVVDEVAEGSNQSHLGAHLHGLVVGTVLEVAVERVQLIGDVEGGHRLDVDEGLSHDDVGVPADLLLGLVELGLQVALVEGAEEDEGRKPRPRRVIFQLKMKPTM